MTSLKDARCILLTGVTGFLGVHLLTELLEQNQHATVLCLVRAKHEEPGAAIQQNLERYGLKTAEFAARIVPVVGDLSQAMFGLDLADWNRWTATVDAVVHCGAAVSLTAPYQALHAVNVQGTLTAIRFAAACKEGTPLVYVSSNGIFPIDNPKEEVFYETSEIGCLPERLGAHDGYGLSKWAADRLVTSAHQKHGLPTLTMRFGNIGWHSQTGRGNALDYQGMLLDGCARVQQRPAVEGWKMEFTPVDFAAKSLVSLSCDAGVLREGSIFHCVQDGFTPADQVFATLEKTCRRTIAEVPFEAW